MKVKIIQYSKYGDENPIIKEEDKGIKKAKLNMTDKEMQELFKKIKEGK